LPPAPAGGGGLEIPTMGGIPPPPECAPPDAELFAPPLAVEPPLLCAPPEALLTLPAVPAGGACLLSEELLQATNASRLAPNHA